MNLTPSPFAPEHFPELPTIKGVRAATGSRGFYAKRGLERDDVFLFVFDEGTHVGGVFTRSATASADVLWCREALAAGQGAARALVANSGNSNAFTGAKGVLKNDATLAAMTGALDVPRTACFLAATGVIGEPLPDPNYVGAIVPELAGRLTAPDWEACTRAFMTTDTFPKAAGTQRTVAGVEVSFAGITKGSGMIAPNMATMLAYVFTDAAIAPSLLQSLTARIADATFNAITVDSDTSTSDTFMIFATGASGMAIIETEEDPRFRTVEEALLRVSLKLAHQIVKDGEGAQKFISIRVNGAVSDASARIVAAAIANSPLVKTALAAGDANWGRIVMAVGKAMEPVDPDKLAIWFGDHQVAEHGGRAEDYDEARASAVCAAREVDITVNLGVGDGEAVVYTCDLTHAYIDINGAYRT
ncbi:MAG: bifunctional glutamate N-acetyltransferase/amino-acid acetyltransferase ArgJ [Hyphomonadaceae bacterium]|nr:bifunctional glutamate N-acetyltransferase/amino-acid acetyltransferase ArgJ [Hyphomonadaceae bacterium]